MTFWEFMDRNIFMLPLIVLAVTVTITGAIRELRK